MPRLAKMVERLTKRIAVVDDDVADVLTGELKEAIQERKRAEARVAELTDYTVALNEQQNEVSRLREIWGSWVGCLNSDPEYISKARQVLKKILGGVPIWVRPLPGENQQDRRWAFAGISRYDAVLAGGIYRDAYAVEHRPTRTPAKALSWYMPRTPPPGGTTWSVGITGDVPIIAGGSDLEEDAHGGRPISGPPMQPLTRPERRRARRA
jgi:hypothetical protein